MNEFIDEELIDLTESVFDNPPPVQRIDVRQYAKEYINYRLSLGEVKFSQYRR